MPGRRIYLINIYKNSDHSLNLFYVYFLFLSKNKIAGTAAKRLLYPPERVVCLSYSPRFFTSTHLNRRRSKHVFSVFARIMTGDTVFVM